MTAPGTAPAGHSLGRRVAMGMAIGVWFGIAAGVAELAMLGLRRFGFGQILWLGRSVVWMAPLADAVLLGLVGAAAGLIVWRRAPAAAARWCAVPPAFLACWTVGLALAALDEWAVLILAAGVAVQVGRAAGRRPEALERLVRRSLPALGAALALIGLGTVGWSRVMEARRLAAVTAPAGAPNVLLLILDTVRSLNLSAYGYARPTSPHLDRLASDGVRFERAVAAAPWTLPSHASLLGGRYADAWDLHWLTPLHGRFPSVAEVLRRRGYATGAFMGNQFYGNPEFGLARGFVRYEVYPLTWVEVVLNSALGRRWVNSRRVRALVGNWDIANRMRADRVNHEFLDWLGGVRGRPFFALLNYFDAHEPYLPPPPFDTLFGPPPRVQRATVFALRNADLLRASRRLLPPDQLAEQVAAYDGSIASVDARIGELLAALERQGALDNTLVIVTSDHGEALGEEGRFLHGFDLSAPVVGVPLIIRYPRGGVPRGTRVAAAVSLKDVAATVLELSGLGSGDVPGRSLSRFWRPGADIGAGSPAFSSFLAPTGGQGGHSIVSGRYHYVRSLDGEEQLFDLTSDPFEAENLIATPEGQRVAAGLRGVLDSLRNAP